MERQRQWGPKIRTVIWAPSDGRGLQATVRLVQDELKARQKYQLLTVSSGAISPGKLGNLRNEAEMPAVP
jgi:hypothetical protein